MQWSTRVVTVIDSGTSIDVPISTDGRRWIVYDPQTRSAIHYDPTAMERSVETAGELVEEIRAQNRHFDAAAWVEGSGSTILALVYCLDDIGRDERREEVWNGLRRIRVEEVRMKLYGIEYVPRPEEEEPPPTYFIFVRWSETEEWMRAGAWDDLSYACRGLKANGPGQSCYGKGPVHSLRYEKYARNPGSSEDRTLIVDEGILDQRAMRDLARAG